MSDARRLIVTADDAGLHVAINDAVVRAHRGGIVTATSVVANGRDFAHAVDLLRECPALAVGVHLTLVEERPLRAAREIPSLLSADGSFHRDYRRFFARYALARISVAEVELEWRAQIESVLNAGLAVTHLNSHQHLHMLPRLFTLTVDLAREYGIGYVRIVNDRGGTAGLVRSVSVAALSFLGRRAAGRAATETPRRTIGVMNAGQLDAARIAGLLGEVDGLTELVAHPASDDRAMADRYAWGYRWEQELAALVDDQLRQTLPTREISLVAPPR